ncbi:MAG: ABC transporter transmembrane domain-containing protein, partial [Dokdonella sp.]
MSMFRLYLRVLGLLAPEKGLAIALVLANLGLASVLFIEPTLFGQVIDALTGKKGGSAPHLIALWALAGFAGIAVNAVVSLQADRLAHRRRQAAISLYFEHAVGLPLSYHADNHTGRLARIMHTGTGNLFGIWLGFFRDHLTTLLAIVVMLPLAMMKNWKLGALMVGLLVVFTLSNAIAMRRTQKRQGEVEQLHHQIATRAGDVLGNVTVVQSFTRLSSEVTELREMMRRVLEAQYPVLRGWAFLSVLNRAASTLTIVAIFALGANLHGKGEVSVGEIVTFVGFSMMLIGRLEQFASFISGLFFQSQSLRDFFELLDQKPLVHDDANAPGMPVPTRGAVEFERVSFSYDKTLPALRDISFKAPAGSTIAVVGATGAGKSTALSLLYRADDPASGRILVDGHDIRHVKLDSLRRNISVVFQDPGLFYRSILENLRIG